MEIREITDRRTWERLCDAADAPLPQRWAYGAAMSSLGPSVRRLTLTDGHTTIAFVQLLARSVCGFRVSLATRGPIWTGTPPVEARVAALSLLRGTLPGRLVLTAEDADAAHGQARLFPVMTAATMAELALGDDMRATMHGKWRNRLARAEAEGLTVVRQKPTRLGWLFEADARTQRTSGYRALPPAFAEAWPDPVLALAVVQHGTPLAGMLFLRHGTTATYHVGWSGEDGRRVSAHNLLTWRGMEMLGSDGVRRLDLGTLDTETAPGLARFKLGTGAVPHRLGGTWLG